MGKIEKEKKMDVMNKITEAVAVLNEVDDYAGNLTHKLSVLDSKEQDLLHYIENNRINILWCYRMIKEIKNIREERRKVKNDMEIIYRYNEIKSKLTSRENRQFILAELHKKEKQLDTTYKNRQYTDEEIQNLLKGGKNNE